VAGDFGARIDELKERVGRGDLTGSVTVDQVYARYQHEDLDLVHPRGGQAMYLRQPVMEHHESYLQKIAETVLDDGGKREMISAVEDLAEDGGVARYAPVEFDDLRASGHPTVTSDGETVYDRAPRVARLSEEELKAKGKARDALDRLTGGGWKRGEGHGSREPGPLNVIHR
jgi:hypothetical protein